MCPRIQVDRRTGCERIACRANVFNRSLEERFGIPRQSASLHSGFQKNFLRTYSILDECARKSLV